MFVSVLHLRGLLLLSLTVRSPSNYGSKVVGLKQERPSENPFRMEKRMNNATIFQVEFSKKIGFGQRMLSCSPTSFHMTCQCVRCEPPSLWQRRQLYWKFTDLHCSAMCHMASRCINRIIFGRSFLVGKGYGKGCAGHLVK